jgi:hypothetical protein
MKTVADFDSLNSVDILAKEAAESMSFPVA